MRLYISKGCVFGALLAVSMPAFSQIPDEALQKRLFNAIESQNAACVLEAVLDPRVQSMINMPMIVSKAGKQLLLSPLHLATYSGLEDVARLLLQHGANVDIVSRLRETPLHIAARKGNTELVTLLLGHGASVNAGEGEGWTPLHGLIGEQIIPLKSELETMSWLGLSENGEEAANYRGKQRALEGAEALAHLLIRNGAKVKSDIIQALNRAGQRAFAEQLIREELRRIQQQYSV